MATRMQQRRGTASQWVEANPTMIAGEIGFETDTGQFKIGDGTTAWLSLPYFKDTLDLDIAGKAPIASPTFTGTVVLPSDTSIGSVSAAEIAVLNGVTASTAELNILDGVTADSSEINKLSGLLASTEELNGLVGKVGLATEEYVDGEITNHADATGNVHGIYDTADLQSASAAASTYVAFEPDSSQTITGTTRIHASNALSEASAVTFTVQGTVGQSSNLTEWVNSDSEVVALVGIDGEFEVANLTVVGDLTVQGTTTTVNTTNYEIRDNMIYMNQAGAFALTDAVGNGTIVTYTAPGHDFVEGDYIVITGVDPSDYNIAGTSLLTIDSVSGDDFVVTKSDTGTYVSGGTARGKSAANPDLGFAAGRTTVAGYGHTGLFRDATDATYKFFDGYTPEPDESLFINTAHESFELAPIEVAGVTTTDLTATGDVDFTGATITGIDALPDQTGNNGKYLTTDGTDASWATLNASPALDDLSDVAITSATTNDVVYFNGSSWVNKYIAAIPSATNAQSGTTYTLVIGDAGKIVEINNSSAITLTVPTNADVAYPVGTQITILQTGAGQITVTGPSGGTLNATPGASLRAQWSSATLLKRATDTWVLIGDLVTTVAQGGGGGGGGGSDSRLKNDILPLEFTWTTN